MFEIVKAGGIMMVPLIICSIIAVAIIVERLWTLQHRRVLPAEITDKVWRWVEQGQIQDKHVQALEHNSPLGKVLAAGLKHRHRDRRIIKESIEDTGRHVVHELERFLNVLGTIASVSPLLGLLGTVFGMIRTFNAITDAGVGNPAALAGGIAEALIATGTGLTVAITALLGFRYLTSKVSNLVIEMEKESIKLVDAIEASAAQYRAERPRQAASQ
jgi:biopolymer transport protein ExbB